MALAAASRVCFSVMMSEASAPLQAQGSGGGKGTEAERGRRSCCRAGSQVCVCPAPFCQTFSEGIHPRCHSAYLRLLFQMCAPSFLLYIREMSSSEVCILVSSVYMYGVCA